MTTAGPLVSFSLRQAGTELKVDNLALPINLTLPSSLGNVGSRPSKVPHERFEHIAPEFPFAYDPKRTEGRVELF